MSLYVSALNKELTTDRPTGISVRRDHQLTVDTNPHKGNCQCLDCQATRLLTAYQAR